MIKVYISGPLTTGNRKQNIRRAVEAARELVERGYAPFVPHLFHYVDPDDSFGWQKWMDVDFAWLESADYVLRLPGESPGAEVECGRARRLNIPVVSSIDAIEVPSILDEAKCIIHGVRQCKYGDPRESLTRIAKIWSAILDKDITPEQVALCMIGIKLGRECHAHDRDNLVDGAGYFAILEMLTDG